MKMEPAPDVSVYGIVVEKDVDVAMRDGARLKADVFRPHDARHLEFGSLSEGQAVGSARQSGGKAEPADELGDGQPAMVGSEGLCRGPGRRARQRKIPRRVRTMVARGVDRSL